MHCPPRILGCIVPAFFSFAPLQASTLPASSTDNALLERVAQHTAIFTKSPGGVPHNPPSNAVVGGPILGNGDVGIALGGSGDRLQFYLGKNDFWSRTQNQIVTVGSLHLETPALKKCSHRQEMDLRNAEVRGRFSKEDLTLSTRSWVAATDSTFVTELKNEGTKPLEMTLRQVVGPRPRDLFRGVAEVSLGAPPAKNKDEENSLYSGLMDEFRAYNRALSPEEIIALGQGNTPETGLVQRLDFAEGPVQGVRDKAFNFTKETTSLPSFPMTTKREFSYSFWLNPRHTPTSKYRKVKLLAAFTEKRDFSHGISLAIGGINLGIAAENSPAKSELPLNTWTHVVFTYDGAIPQLYINGERIGYGPQTVHQQTTSDGLEFVRRGDPETTPESDLVAVATRVIGVPVNATPEGSVKFTLPPGESAELVSVVRGNLQSKQPLEEARKELAEWNADKLKQLAQAHAVWWRNYWLQSGIEIPDKVIEAHYYGNLYQLGAASRADQMPPGLYGPWVTSDRPNWSGDFHMNYNYQATFWGLYSGNRLEQAANYDRPILAYLPQAREEAKNIGKKGVYFKVGLNPWGYPSGSGNSFHGQRSNASYVLVNMLMFYEFSQDDEYLSKTLYPFLREVGDFWESYLTWREAENRYVIEKDAIDESRAAVGTNPLLSLGFVRTAFKNLLAYSEQLGVDADRRAKWQHILDHISDYPTQVRNGKTVFRYTEDTKAWHHSNTMGVQHVFPGGAIGLDSDPKLLEIARNTLIEQNAWRDFNGFPTFYTAAARLGHDPKQILEELRRTCEKSAGPNYYFSFGGGGTENAGGITKALHEMLLQSHEGVLRFFPVWPAEQAAAFYQLRAVGAFLVNARNEAGAVVSPVTIKSERGRICRVQNPWPDKVLKVERVDGGSRKAVSLTPVPNHAERYQFPTEVGATYELLPN